MLSANHQQDPDKTISASEAEVSHVRPDSSASERDLHPKGFEGDAHRFAPWGFWATLGFSSLVVAAYFLCGILAVFLFGDWTALQETGGPAGAAMSQGVLVIAAILASSPITLGLCAFFARLRRGPSLEDYFHLYDVPLKTLLLWCLVLFLFFLGWDGLAMALERPIIQKFMLDVYATSPSKPLLFLAFVVAAPLSEEIFFRGFLFKGILHSKWGGLGAVLVTSLVWAPLHNQYDLYGILTVTAIGLLFGLARWKTNSLYTPILMHALTNFLALLEVLLCHSFNSIPS